MYVRQYIHDPVRIWLKFLLEVDFRVPIIFKFCMRIIFTTGIYKTQDMMIHMSWSTDFRLVQILQG